jgi:hypothetical protein
MYCSGHSTPQSYAGATFTLLSKGNKSNGTHWQLTSKVQWMHHMDWIFRRNAHRSK